FPLTKHPLREKSRGGFPSATGEAVPVKVTEGKAGGNRAAGSAYAEPSPSLPSPLCGRGARGEKRRRSPRVVGGRAGSHVQRRADAGQAANDARADAGDEEHV